MKFTRTLTPWNTQSELTLRFEISVAAPTDDAAHMFTEQLRTELVDTVTQAMTQPVVTDHGHITHWNVEIKGGHN